VPTRPCGAEEGAQEQCAPIEALLVEPVVGSQEKSDSFLTYHSKLHFRDVVEAKVRDVYHAEKGPNFFGRFFNTFKGRMALVKKAAARRSESAKRAAAVEARFAKIENIPDFIALCEVVVVPTGEFLPARPGKDEKEEFVHVCDDEGLPTFDEFEKAVMAKKDKRVPVTKTLRRVRSADRAEAANWIRHYVRNKNRLLTADEVSHATINRYVEQFAEDMKLDAESSTYLINCALRMVPLPMPVDFDIMKTVHCPVARAARNDLRAISAPDF
jgi:hypothetical protein